MILPTLPNSISRRHFAFSAGISSLSVALNALISQEGSYGNSYPNTGTAKSIIFLFMSGGPSQVDTFDPKPTLRDLEGQDVPESIAEFVPRIKRAGLKNLLPSPWGFRKCGECGVEVSDLLPHVSEMIDELCVIRSMTHRNPVHGPGECVALTGSSTGDRPSVGAWSLYGLGKQSNSLPSFIAMNIHNDGMQYPQAAGWSSGFLPSRFQGTVIDSERGIRNATPPRNVDSHRRSMELEAIEAMNRDFATQIGTTDLDARLRSYQQAFAMQTAGPELFSLKSEDERTRRAYGLQDPKTEQVGRACLLGRRMVERGVPFIQIRVGGWDAHSNLKSNHEKLAQRTDLPIATLIKDLKSRGLLEQTLVVWAGEFGRTPTMEGKSGGRDHSPAAYSIWMAGGGIQGGQVIGETDPIGYTVVENPISPNDMHATMLQLMGINPHQLIFNHHGLQESPLGVTGGRVIHEVFA
ncbi:DUF1501 domain-containing protein [Rhodopirellula sp.]|nr:DUF1501 domain-containing protein [Rhodopirellula sp.]